MNQIKCIFFDLGWTLLEPCSGDWNLNQKFYELFSREKISRLDYNVWQHAYNTAYLPFIENPKMTSEQEQIERYTRFYLTLFDQAKLDGTFQHAVKLAVDMVENLATMSLIPGSLETLKTLKDEGYRVGIISDTWPYIGQRIHAFKLDERGFIKTDEECRASAKGIYAAGDCRVKTVRQLTTAASDGAIAALNACNNL